MPFSSSCLPLPFLRSAAREEEKKDFSRVNSHPAAALSETGEVMRVALAARWHEAKEPHAFSRL